MNTMRVLVIATALFCYASADIAAQDSGALVLAAREIAARLPADAAIAVDPRIAPKVHVLRWEGEWPPETLASIARVLDATVLQQEDVRTCSEGPPSPRSCRLTGADYFVKFTRPLGEGDVINVYVDVHRPSPSTRQPIFKQVYRVTLGDDGRGLRVIATDVVAIT